MLTLDEDARAALEQSHTAGYSVQAFYGADLTVEDVPVTGDGSITFDASGQIQANGSVFLARDGGDSLVPQSKTDPLAPYGQELAIARTVTYGAQTWSIPLGRFRIARVPKASEYFRRFPSMLVRVGWSAQLDLVDRFDIIEADDFLATTGPKAGNTTWQEVQRLSPIPIIQSLPDRPLPSGLVYQSKGDAIAQLIGNLGGVPYLTREGALTAHVRDNWLTATDPVFTINGTIDMQDGMSNQLYNSVVVTCPGDATILGFAEITDESNPLAVTRPIGRRTYRHSSPLVDTQAKADTAAQTILARVSTQQSRVVTVTCLPRPDIELGDFGLAKDTLTGKEILGEVSKMTFQMDPTAAMSMDMIVAETR